MGNKQTKHAKSKRDEVRPCSFTYTLTYTTHAHACAHIHKPSNLVYNHTYTRKQVRTHIYTGLNVKKKLHKPTGSYAKACPIAWGKFDSKKHGFGQVHGLI